MKLRNKKTGEIIDVKDALTNSDDYPNHYLINDDWEDAPEEPKKAWYLRSLGEPTEIVFGCDDFIQTLKAIGNYFETKEEAERAVEKLKAWKRLKDKGFKFIGVRGIGKVIDFDIPEPYNHIGFDEYEANKDEKEFYDDLLLLFGGEE